MSEQQIRELKELIARTTPGPWESHMLGGGKGSGNDYSVRADNGDPLGQSSIALCHRTNPQAGWNAAFIASAHAAIPKLLDALLSTIAHQEATAADYARTSARLLSVQRASEALSEELSNIKRGQVVVRRLLRGIAERFVDAEDERGQWYKRKALEALGEEPAS